jgi:thioredoxin-like negative regulator of GroEL
MLIEVTDLSFEERIIQSKTPVLLAFCADDCSASQKLLAMLTSAATRSHGSATFAKASLAKAPGLAARLGVALAPTLLLLRNGAVSFQFVGELSPRELDELLASAAGENFVTRSRLVTPKS